MSIHGEIATQGGKVLADALLINAKALGLGEGALSQVASNRALLSKILAEASKELITGSTNLYFSISLYSFGRFTVPDGYVHDSQLADFAKQKDDLGIKDFDSEITDQNFLRTPHRLVAGKEYTALIFEILGSREYEGFRPFVERQGALDVGPQGLTLVRQLCSDLFPDKENWSALTIEKGENLYSDGRGEKHIVVLSHRGIYAQTGKHIGPGSYILVVTE